MDGASLKKWAIVLLIIHLVLICLKIINHGMKIADEDDTAYSVRRQRRDYMKKHHKEPSADEMESFADHHVAVEITVIIIYLIFLGLIGLVLKGVFSANHCLILMGSIVAILGCIPDGYGVFTNYEKWHWSNRAKVRVIGYFFAVIFDMAEAVVLFMLSSSIVAEGMDGAGMA